VQESQHAGMIDERRIGSCAEFAHDIMSVNESTCYRKPPFSAHIYTEKRGSKVQNIF